MVKIEGAGVKLGLSVCDKFYRGFEIQVFNKEGVIGAFFQFSVRFLLKKNE